MVREMAFQFEWDESKAAANASKHGIAFELAATVFKDPRLLTTADLEHSETEERWFSIGWSSDGKPVVRVGSRNDESPRYLGSRSGRGVDSTLCYN
jgi:hypothetical protein